MITPSFYHTCVRVIFQLHHRVGSITAGAVLLIIIGVFRVPRKKNARYSALNPLSPWLIQSHTCAPVFTVKSNEPVHTRNHDPHRKHIGQPLYNFNTMATFQGPCSQRHQQHQGRASSRFSKAPPAPKIASYARICASPACRYASCEASLGANTLPVQCRSFAEIRPPATPRPSVTSHGE